MLIAENQFSILRQDLWVIPTLYFRQERHFFPKCNNNLTTWNSAIYASGSYI